MHLKFYACGKKVNSFRIPTDNEYLFEMTGVEYRGSVSTLSPTLIFTNKSGLDVLSANYLYITENNRYYFIDNTIVQGNQFQLDCTEDVLASFRDMILQQKFYITRSENFRNNAITDTLYPTRVNPTLKTAEFENKFAQVEDGLYILGIASGGNESSRVGCNVYYIVEPDEMESFMQQLMNSSDFTSLADLGDSIIKAIVNPISYIQSCIWLPISKADVSTKSAPSIDFGWYSVDCDCDILDVNATEDTYHKISVTLNFNDDFIDAPRIYAMYPPYSNYSMIIQPFGEFNLTPEVIECIISEMQLTVEIIVDLITGMGTLKLKNENDAILHIYTAQLGVDIPVGDVLQDFAGATLSAANAATSLVSGNITGAAANIVSGINNAAPSPSVTGVCGGFGQLGLKDWWTFNRVYYPPLIEGEYKGEPYYAMDTLENIEGYVQCSAPHLEGTMLLSEKQQIIGYLESGCFVE